MTSTPRTSAEVLRTALDALKSVRQIIADGAMTGFNCHDGDWAERLFFSQQQTSRAIELAEAQTSDPVLAERESGR